MKSMSWRRRRSDVNMECEIAVHQVSDRVLGREELNAAAQDVLHSCKAVHPNICGVNDRVDQARSCRKIDLGPERLNKRIADPIEHSAVRDKRIFYVRVSRINCCSVAPGNPSSDEIQCTDNALAVQMSARVGPKTTSEPSARQVPVICRFLLDGDTYGTSSF